MRHQNGAQPAAAGAPTVSWLYTSKKNGAASASLQPLKTSDFAELLQVQTLLYHTAWTCGGDVHQRRCWGGRAGGEQPRQDCMIHERSFCSRHRFLMPSGHPLDWEQPSQSPVSDIRAGSFLRPSLPVIPEGQRLSPQPRSESRAVTCRCRNFPTHRLLKSL